MACNLTIGGSIQRFLQKRFPRRLATVALLLGLPPAASAAETTATRFEVGLARSCFSNVNVNDALAAYRVFLENIGHRRGYQLNAEVTIYNDTAQFESALLRGKVHFAVMDTWQYLSLEHCPEIRPYFVPSVDGQVGRRYVVLVRRDSGVHSLLDLRGRPILLLDTIDNNVCRSWLESLLSGDAQDDSAKFFSTIEHVAKPTAAVLPVFFGQKAACVVDEATFNLMKELNPQVGSMLTVIAVSERIADYIICLGEQKWPLPEAKADSVNALADLAADPAGRQMLALFKVSGLVPFKESYLAPTRSLRRRHDERPSVQLAPPALGNNP
jgi:phosphonate transport system substrate-binding protein